MFKNIHLPYYERIWLILGFFSLVVFLTVLGILAVGLGLNPPGHMKTIPPELVRTSAPFDKPTLVQIGPNEYKATMVAQMLSSVEHYFGILGIHLFIFGFYQLIFTGMLAFQRSSAEKFLAILYQD